MSARRTTVGIIGAGPAGLLLSRLLDLEGIDNVVLESRSRSYVEQRVRAGVIEHGIVELLDRCGVADRLHREGLVHHGIEMRFARERHRIPLSELAGGRAITVYGQQEVVKDLIAARLASGGTIEFDAEVTAIEPGGNGAPAVTYQHAGSEHRLECSVIAGCDGFHGVSRAALPADTFTAYERTYPFAWLGILAAVAPSSDELVYCRHDRGFALLSMRSPTVTRLYLQVDPGEELGNWSDDRIWEELRRRFETDDGWELADGPVLEKSITPMRSFVLEPLGHGHLYLAGDAAHIVPPTGAKGMNLALADVDDLAAALVASLTRGDRTLLEGYSDRCLRRAWAAQEFSTSMTTMFHPLASDEFGGHIQLARLREVASLGLAARRLAESYVDLSSL